MLEQLWFTRSQTGLIQIKPAFNAKANGERGRLAEWPLLLLDPTAVVATQREARENARWSASFDTIGLCMPALAGCGKTHDSWENGMLMPLSSFRRKRESRYFKCF
jgi:hypothetical protein